MRVSMGHNEGGVVKNKAKIEYPASRSESRSDNFSGDRRRETSSKFGGYEFTRRLRTPSPQCDYGESADGAEVGTDLDRRSRSMRSPIFDRS